MTQNFLSTQTIRWFACLFISLLYVGMAQAQVFSGGSINILDAAPSSPYPSTINVSGLPSTITTTIKVRIGGFSHTAPNDVGIYLESPSGQRVLIYDANGNATAVVGVSIIFDDSAPTGLTTSATLSSGSFRINPKPGPVSIDIFTTGGAASSMATTLASFNGSNPNGAWKLYVQDFAGIDAGSISSWAIDFVPVLPCVVAATPTATTPQPACVGSMVTLQSNCPTNSPSSGTIWQPSTGAAVFANGNTYNVPASDLSYTAQCVTPVCTTAVSAPVQLSTKRFDVNFVNVQASRSRTNANPNANSIGWWPAPINGGTALGRSTATSPAIYYTESNPAPRYWTAELQICDATLAPQSVIWDLYRFNEVTGKQEQTFYTIENGAPWFMFANTGYTTLNTLDHPVYGFGASYAGGFPKGKYVLSVYVQDAKGKDYGSVPSPTTRTAQGNTLASLKYYFNITSTAGVGAGAARVASAEPIKSELELASVYPNPTKSKLNVMINDSKGEDVTLNLIDLMGRSVMSRTIVPSSNVHTEEIDIAAANAGIYFMKVQTPSKSKTIKVSKE